MELKEASARYLADAGELVPKGYKQTEVGLIPEDWEIKLLHEFAVIKTGPFGTLLKASEYSASDDGVPLISVGEIREGFLGITEETPRVSELIVKRLPQFVLKCGDIVFGRKGGVDRSAVIQQKEDGWFLGSDGINVRIANSCYDKYLGFQFQSSRIKGWLLQHAIGTTMPSLNQNILRNVIVPIPPTLTEQEAIAEALSDVDALLESLEQLIAKKRLIKQGAMQELLTGKKRLPGFSGEWEVKRLGDVLDKIVGGGTPSRSNPKYWGNQIPWATVKDFASFHPYHTQENISSEGLINSSSNLIPKGTLITSTRMALGKAIIYEVDVAINQDLKALFTKRYVNIKFLYYWFELNALKIDELGSGSTVKGISLPDLKAMEFYLPLQEEQAAIAKVLSDMAAEIAALESKLAKARQLKQGMMQELLSGRIRLV
ncbi:restriction endonuclease subunit S [Methylomarinum vadi]|uniref:restriction endonuclease subunit S n=1 Tax=Methylomarinum vadi TaxID=438855 RepID=UPI0004DF2AD2|nr:restriction endonuclease subunit S [Methylomarinum vadi]